MQLKVIGSNSAGNGYVLTNGKDKLLIECGLPVRAVKRAMNFDLSNMGCIVTHSHGDHGKYIERYMECGIDVHASEHTLSNVGVLNHHRAKVMDCSTNKVYQVGGFRVKPFPVNHDVPCMGFLISHTECGMVLFLTDTVYCDYTFPGLNNIIIECNHALDIIDNNGTEKFLRDRIVQSHMNLDTCKGILRANDLTQVNNVVLIHLSDDNSDATRFKQEVEQLTGKKVTVAEAGITIDFNKSAI